jgi:hypothetical protein
MSGTIEAFGGDGLHEVHVKTQDGEQVAWVKRDLWFDRNDAQNWIVWV